MKKSLGLLFVWLACTGLSTAYGKEPASLPNVLIGENGTGNGQFGFQIDGMTATPDGSLLVSDGNNSRVQFFSPGGKFLRRWGHKGDKPGDMQMPRNIYVAKNKTVFIEDRGRHLMNKFNLSGKYLGHWPIPEDMDIIGFDPEGNSYGFGLKESNLTIFGPDGSTTTPINPKLVNWPERMVGDGRGNFFILDRGTDQTKHHARLFRLDGGTQVVWQITADKLDSKFDLENSIPLAIHLDGLGNVFILTSGTQVSTWGKVIVPRTSYLIKYSPAGVFIQDYCLSAMTQEDTFYDFALLNDNRVAFKTTGCQMTLVSLDKLDQKPEILEAKASH